MKNKTVKEQIDELNGIIAWFDSDEFELEKAFEKFEDAQKLAENIEKTLKTMKNKVSIIQKSFQQ